MYKNFIQNIGLKEHITAVHEERDSIMINVAKNLHYLKVYIEIVHKKNFEFNCDYCGKNFSKAFMNHIKTIYWANFFSGVFTAGIFLPGIIILANLLSGVFTAAGITEPPGPWRCH